MLLDKYGKRIPDKSQFAPSRSYVGRVGEYFVKELERNRFFERFMSSIILDSHGVPFHNPIKAENSGDKIKIGLRPSFGGDT